MNPLPAPEPFENPETKRVEEILHGFAAQGNGELPEEQEQILLRYLQRNENSSTLRSRIEQEWLGPRLLDLSQDLHAIRVLRTLQGPERQDVASIAREHFIPWIRENEIDANLKTVFCRFLRNKKNDRIRRSIRERTNTAKYTDYLLAQEQTYSDPADIAADAEIEELRRHLFERWINTEADPVTKYVVEGRLKKRPESEIAEELGASRDMVQSRWRKAMKSFKHFVIGELGDGYRDLLG